MEHVKSTLATTFVLVMGLVTAAQVLHPREPARERQHRDATVVATANAESATAWSDPPVRASQAVAIVEQTARPASFTMLPVAMTASLSGASFQPSRTRRAEPAQGRRVVQALNRSRSASLGQQARAERPPNDPGAASGQPGRAVQGDPIGTLLNDLGIGRDGEG